MRLGRGRGIRRTSPKYYYLTEVYRSWEGPWWVGVFVEHKDVFGLTVRAEVGNLINARHRFDRTVYDGPANAAPILLHTAGTTS